MKKSEKDKKKEKKTDSKKPVKVKKKEEKVKEIKDDKLKEIREIKEDKPESELEEEIVPEQFEQMPIDDTSKILSIARDLAFQPAPVEAEQPLETMMENVPDKEDEKTSKTYVEFKKDYETERPGEEKEDGKYEEFREESIETKQLGRSELKPESFKRRQEENTFRQDYAERKQEEDEKQGRKYEIKRKTKRL